VAYVDGELLLEAHPPVDAQGQTMEPQLEQFEQLLDRALGNTTAAIHWDFARQTLQAANGIPTVVGLQAETDNAQKPDQSGQDLAAAAAAVAEANAQAEAAAAAASTPKR
jgi:hypothetical protein